MAILICKHILQSAVHAEVEKLRLELQTTVAMYERACEGLVHAQTKVGDFSEIKGTESILRLIGC